MKGEFEKAKVLSRKPALFCYYDYPDGTPKPTEDKACIPIIVLVYNLWTMTKSG